jgi:hypothetical protein
MDPQDNKNWWQRLDPMTALVLLLLALGGLALLVGALVSPVSSGEHDRPGIQHGTTNR